MLKTAPCARRQARWPAVILRSRFPQSCHRLTCTAPTNVNCSLSLESRYSEADTSIVVAVSPFDSLYLPADGLRRPDILAPASGAVPPRRRRGSAGVHAVESSRSSLTEAAVGVLGCRVTRRTGGAFAEALRSRRRLPGRTRPPPLPGLPPWREAREYGRGPLAAAG